MDHVDSTESAEESEEAASFDAWKQLTLGLDAMEMRSTED